MTRLWPDNGASLDFLLSLGTGAQSRRTDKIPAAVKFGGYVTIRAMFERQLDAPKLWDQFMNGITTPHIRSRIHRINPPIEGDYIALHQYQMMGGLRENVRKWSTVGDGASQIQDLAEILLANLFFFEPDDDAPTSRLADPTYESLHGTIRCRLAHDSIPLRELLENKAESFWYTEVTKADTESLDQLEQTRWVQIRPSSGGLASEVTIENNRKMFRLKQKFSVKQFSNLYQVLAVKLKGSNKRIPISGFPSTLSDLQERTNMKWLQ
jgi:hypothetical protein